MKFFSPLLGASLRVFVRELRATRKVMQHGIDTYRQVNGLPPLFEDEDLGATEEPDLGEKKRPQIVGQGDMLTLDILSALASEQGVKWSDVPELEALAYDRGWVDEVGRILLVPEAYQTVEFAEFGMFSEMAKPTMSNR